MRQWLASLILAVLVVAGAFAAGPGPQEVKFDQTVSINAQETTVGRLLQLWDQTTGMQSSIPPELANRPVSVNFSGLGVNEAVRKIFEKLQLDYVFIEGQGIVVTAASQTEAAAEPAPVYNDAPQGTSEPSEEELPEPPRPVVPPLPPPEIWTPFGPILNSGGNAFIHLPPVPGETQPLPFFAPARRLPTPPAGTPNGPAQNSLFRPVSIYN